MDLVGRWRSARWFGFACESPTSMPTFGPHYELWQRLNRSGRPVAECLAELEAELEATGQLAAFDRFVTRREAERLRWRR